MINRWIWTEVAENLKPDRKSGDSVPIGFLTKGHDEFFPYRSWIEKGYVRRVES